MDNIHQRILVKTLFGLEDILADELSKYGAKNIKKINRAVEADANKELVYKLNLLLRTGLAVYCKITQGECKNQNQLYELVKSVNWSSFFSLNKTIAVEAFSNSKTLNHSKFVEQKVKDAVVDHFREKLNRRPSVDTKKPDIKIYVHINMDTCSIYLNSSGMPLYYRGYNKRTGPAPINDILAAGIIMMSGWNKKDYLLDPMCGCATIPAEAYMIANNIPSALSRNFFSFKKWLDFDNSLWEKIRKKAISEIVNNNPIIEASDIDRKIIGEARINLNRISPNHSVKLACKDFFELKPSHASGVIITNPPYGMRFSNMDINEFYKKIGDKLKFEFNNFTVWMISSELSAIKLVGLKPEKRISLFNGQLECKLNKYSIYKGSRKDLLAGK